MASHELLKVVALDNGMISAYPPNVFPQDQGFTTMLYNFDFDEIPGQVRKRYGVAELFSELPGIAKGSFQFLKDGIEPLYIVATEDQVVYYNSNELVDDWEDISPEGWDDDEAVTCDFVSLLGLLIVSDGVNTPFKWDGTITTELANMPKAKYLTELKGRIIAAGMDTDALALRGSDVGDPAIWDETDTDYRAFKVYPGGEGAITSITTIEDIVLIGKKYSLHALVGTSVYDFQVIPIDLTVGVGSHWTVKHIRGSAFFVSSEGEIYSVEPGARPERRSAAIQDIIRTVNIGRIDEARAAVMEKYHYVVTLPVGETGFITLIYDIIRRRWRTSDLHIGSSAVSEEVLGYCFTYPEGLQLYNLDPDALHDTKSDRTYLISAYLETIQYHFNYPEAEKEINNLWLGVLTQDNPYKVWVEARIDGSEWFNITPLGVEVNGEAGVYRRIRVPVGKLCSTIQFRISNAGLDEPITLLDLCISYIVKEIE